MEAKYQNGERKLVEITAGEPSNSRQSHESPVKMKTNSQKSKRLPEAKTSRTAQRKGDYAQRRVRMRRTNEEISNDISEGMPVTPGEVLRCLKWERRQTFKLQNTINRLREAMVRVGLTLAADESRNPRHTECLLTLSQALKHPNEKLRHPAGKTKDARKEKDQ